MPPEPDASARRPEKHAWSEHRNSNLKPYVCVMTLREIGEISRIRWFPDATD